MPDVTVNTSRGPMKVPDWADALEKGEVLPNTPGLNKGSAPAKVTKKTYVFEVDGHEIESDHMPSKVEAKAIRDRLSPPLSQMQEGQSHPYIATAARVGGGLIGGTLGAISPVPGGAAIGGALGAAGAEALTEKYIEGRDINPAEVGAQGLLGAIAPGAGSTVAKGAAKAAAYGFGSVTLDALAKGEGLPDVGNLALGTIIGGLSGGALTKLHMRSSLREVLPSDVADEAHSLLTKGKLTTPATVATDDLAEIKWTRRLNLGRMSVDEKIVSRGPKGRFTSSTKRVPVDPVDMSDLKTGGAPEWVYKGEFDPKTGERVIKEPPVEIPPSKVKGATAAFSRFSPKIWVYDRLQKQSGVPVYDEVYRPIREAVESGDREKLNEVIKEVERKFLPYPKGKDYKYDPVRETIEHTIDMANGYRDKTIQSIEFMFKNWARRMPVFGREISDETARRWAQNSISLPSASLIAGRGDPLIQNAAQSLQTGYAFLGGRWYGKGIARAFTKKGYDEAVAMGALVPEHSLAMEIPKPSTWYTKAVDLGFRLYKKVDDKNNAIMFLGQYERTMWAARKAGKDVVRFTDLANLDLGMPRAEMQGIAKLFSEGRVQEAAQRAGLIRASVTQFMYGMTERPQALTSTAGRVFGGFGNWGAFYSNLLKETATGEASAGKKAIFFTRWALANTALGYGLASTYSAINSKNPERRAWGNVLFGPLMNGLGPLVDVYQGLDKAFYKATTGQSGAGKQAIKAVKPIVPFAGAVDEWSSRLKKTMEDRQ